MTFDQLRRRLVYLDKAFIADLYEQRSGVSPSTVVTSSQGGKAGAAIPFFSAEVNAQETRAFSISTLKMLEECYAHLAAEPNLDLQHRDWRGSSAYGWFEGPLSVFKTTTSRTKGGVREELASSEHFQIRSADHYVALITTAEYFSNGISAFTKMQHTVLKDMRIPVRALLRVFAARGHAVEWIATPLLILENDLAQPNGNDETAIE